MAARRAQVLRIWAARSEAADGSASGRGADDCATSPPPPAFPSPSCTPRLFAAMLLTLLALQSPASWWTAWKRASCKMHERHLLSLDGFHHIVKTPDSNSPQVHQYVIGLCCVLAHPAEVVGGLCDECMSVLLFVHVGEMCQRFFSSPVRVQPFSP